MADNSDCDDTNDQVYPGAPELCDGVDNNCDGPIDNDPSCNAGPLITVLRLVDANSNAVVQVLQDGESYSLAALMTDFMSVEATANTETESVVLTISGPLNNTRTESVPPYALFGDSGGNFTGETFAPGNYTVTATPYSGNGGTGTAGPVVAISFELTSGTMQSIIHTSDSWSETSAVNDRRGEEISVYPNPASTVLYVDLADFAGSRGELVIFNDLGQLVWQDKFDEVDPAPLEVNLLDDRFGDGLFLLVFRPSEGKSVSKRFIVNRTR